jgi:hypothetical protein
MKIFLFLIVALSSFSVFSQENLVTFSGGYAFANVEDVSGDATGWRINGTYEYRPNGGSIAHGISIGYISVEGDGTTNIGSLPTSYTVNSLPIYYAPKYLFGNKSLEGFVKGALGMQFSDLETTTQNVRISSNDSGFYGGLGVGGMKTFKEKFFINAEYEWAYMSNSFYKDGFMNSFMVGLGVRF